MYACKMYNSKQKQNYNKIVLFVRTDRVTVFLAADNQILGSFHFMKSLHHRIECMCTRGAIFLYAFSVELH